MLQEIPGTYSKLVVLWSRFCVNGTESCVGMNIIIIKGEDFNFATLAIPNYSF